MLSAPWWRALLFGQQLMMAGGGGAAHLPHAQDDSDDVYDEKGVADDMLDFLHHFFAGEGAPLVWKDARGSCARAQSQPCPWCCLPVPFVLQRTPSWPTAPSSSPASPTQASAAVVVWVGGVAWRLAAAPLVRRQPVLWGVGARACSPAGHYVPAVSHRVWLNNKNKEGPIINLKVTPCARWLCPASTPLACFVCPALSATTSLLLFLLPLLLLTAGPGGGQRAHRAVHPVQRVRRLCAREQADRLCGAPGPLREGGAPLAFSPAGGGCAAHPRSLARSWWWCGRLCCRRARGCPSCTRCATWPTSGARAPAGTLCAAWGCSTAW